MMKLMRFLDKPLQCLNFNLVRLQLVLHLRKQWKNTTHRLTNAYMTSSRILFRKDKPQQLYAKKKKNSKYSQHHYAKWRRKQHIAHNNNTNQRPAQKLVRVHRVIGLALIPNHPTIGRRPLSENSAVIAVRVPRAENTTSAANS
jgi:hypothetical protein